MTCAQCGAETAADEALCPACAARPSSSKAPTMEELRPAPGVLTEAPGAGSAGQFAPGEPFGDRYTIVEEVGAGGMGHVYKAIDRNLGKTVALKLVRPVAAGQGLARERFRRELALAQAVTHPNVCRVHDLGEVGGALYITMEFVEGQTLDDLIQSVGHLSPKQTVALGRQICAGLQAIHERGIVHRDLKPGNIMVDRSGHPILMDFGLAFHQGRERLTGAGSVLGTLAYLSPEQARGRTTDYRSDLYALGLILFEMLTGQRPPADGGTAPLALRDAGDRCPPPSRLVSDVPSGLDAIVMRCLEREPERRFPSAADLESALAGAAAGLSSGTAWPARPGTGPLTLVRGPKARGAAVAAVGALLLAAAWYWRGREPGPPPPDAPRAVIAVLPLDNVTKDPADEHIGVGVADSLITRLAALPTLTVVSRSATLEQRGRPTRAVARDLGATYLVNGGVQRSGQVIHVTLNLVRPDDSVAWGHEYEAGPGEIFALQRRMAEGLTDALQLTLTRADRERLAREPTADAEAFAIYSHARALVERPDVPGNVARAIETFQQAVQKDPRFSLAYAGLGEAYWTQYQETKDEAMVTKALNAITEALRLDPDQPLTRFALARLYQGTGRADEAVEELRRILALQPANDDAHRVLGDILLSKGRPEEALAELNKAVELRPHYWENHRILGRAYYQLGRYGDAVRSLTRVTELQPDNSRGFQMLGAAYDKMGNDDLALVNYRRAIELNPDARAYSNLGTLYYRQGRFAEAAQAYGEAARLEPSPAKYRNLGDLYTRLGQAARAREHYLRAVDLSQSILRVNPRDAHALGILAVSEAKLGRHDVARRHSEEAVGLAPLDAEVLYRKAVVAALAGRSGAALAALRQALSQGYSAADAARDDDFGSLRDSPAFRQLVGLSPPSKEKGGL
jgi:tetratricopeptide (TPR) repeat protein/TolB-like protein/tRNA A-37 threonylcarbamoyl transferase component Bud32